MSHLQVVHTLLLLMHTYIFFLTNTFARESEITCKCHVESTQILTSATYQSILNVILHSGSGVVAICVSKWQQEKSRSCHSVDHKYTLEKMKRGRAGGCIYFQHCYIKLHYYKELQELGPFMSNSSSIHPSERFFCPLGWFCDDAILPQ